MELSIKRLFVVGSAAAAIAGSVLGTAAAADAATTAPRQVVARTSSVGGPIKRSEVISRAKFWYDHRGSIRYNQFGSYPDPQGRRYRSDCSGYVSMALHLRSSLSTVTLPGVGRKIAKRSMQKGDFIGHMGPGTGGNNGHVRIFESWANRAHTLYWAYDFGSTPVRHQIYALSSPSNYTAYSYTNIRNG